MAGGPSGKPPTWLDEADSVRVKPDLVCTLAAGIPRGGRRREVQGRETRGFPQADPHQLLAHCTTLELPVEHLVTRKDQGTRNGGTSSATRA